MEHSGNGDISKMSATDAVARAAAYATQAHKRIDHRRKYSSQPYDVHLRAVAELVSSVTDDPEIIAAAWLHDTVEDTPATFYDVEREFGPRVARFVADVTDVSKPSDGNRAARKALDRDHLAQACPEAKTIKLADLIDNCNDICRNDPRFARVFITEAAALLPVLTEGDQRLHDRARDAVATCAERLGMSPEVSHPGDALEVSPEMFDGADGLRVPRLFVQAFTAMDIAEPLRSFDGDRSMPKVARRMQELGVDVVGVRAEGIVNGYVLLADRGSDTCAHSMRRFARDQVVEAKAPLTEVVQVLTRHNHCFVSSFGSVTGVATRADIQKPVGRMWLFGMITIVEMGLTERIRQTSADCKWSDWVSAARLEKARALLEERRRRGQHCDLLDCVQLSDKAQVLLRVPGELEYFGFKTKGAAKRVIKELESLRNNLAHSQDIVTHDWAQIARITQRIHELVSTQAQLRRFD